MKVVLPGPRRSWERRVRTTTVGITKEGNAEALQKGSTDRNTLGAESAAVVGMPQQSCSRSSLGVEAGIFELGRVKDVHPEEHGREYRFLALKLAGAG